MTKIKALTLTALFIAGLISSQVHAKPTAMTPEEIKQKVSEYNYVLGTQTLAAPYQFSKNNSLIEQVNQVKNLGSNIVKLSLGRSTANKYGFKKTANKAKSILELIETTPAYQKVFDMKFKYYQAWVHSMTDGKWRDGITEKEAVAYYREMYELSAYLLKRYSGSGKVFMLGNWEGDWLLHGKGKGNSTPSEIAIQGMTSWLNIRQKAMDDAKAKVKHNDVELYHYVEVNLAIKGLKGEASVAHSVLPKTNVDLVSYSAYEAIKNSKKPNIDAVRKPLTEIVNYLEGQLKPKSDLPFKRRVFIGEYGYHAFKDKPESVKYQFIKSKYVAQVAIELDLPFALIWQMYNNEYTDAGISKEMSLIDESGDKRLLFYLHKVFAQKMKYFVAEAYKKTGKAPSEEAYKARALKVIKNLSYKQMQLAKTKLEKQQKQKQQQAKKKA